VALRPRSVRWSLVNLRIAYPELDEPQRIALARESFIHLGLNLVDYLCSHRWSDAQVVERCPLQGLENIEKALSRGRGALLLTLHMGNWEIGVQAMAIHMKGQGSRLAVVGRQIRNEAVYARVLRTRTRGATEVVEQQQAGQRVLRALRQGRPVAMLLDQYTHPSRGILAPLFGLRCSTSAAIATFAQRTGAAVVPCYVIRTDPEHHRIVFLPELEPLEVRGLGRAAQIELATAHYNGVLERIIRAHPEQWVWGHRRFRHSPDLSWDPYKGRYAGQVQLQTQS
jgi:KDO2-lipid IV(A) lauroyltransferase